MSFEMTDTPKAGLALAAAAARAARGFSFFHTAKMLLAPLFPRPLFTSFFNIIPVVRAREREALPELTGGLAARIIKEAMGASSDDDNCTLKHCAVRWRWRLL
jgi:hypothetical protein